jgi:hypothetical protein
MYFHNKSIWNYKCEYYLLESLSNVKHFNRHAIHSYILLGTDVLLYIDSTQMQVGQTLTLSRRRRGAGMRLPVRAQSLRDPCCELLSQRKGEDGKSRRHVQRREMISRHGVIR